MSAVQLAAAITERGLYSAPRSKKPLDAATVAPESRTPSTARASSAAEGSSAWLTRSKCRPTSVQPASGPTSTVFQRRGRTPSLAPAEAGGYDKFWTQETAGRDPFALLGHLAGRTERIGLGVGIAVIYGRDPVAMRAGAATVHELSGGRMLLGLGSSHRDTVSEVRGHEYRGPLSAMRTTWPRIKRPRTAAPSPHGRPPVVLAALRPRMLALAATATDGAFPYLVPETYVGGARARLDEAAAAAGKPRPVLVVSLPCLRSTDALAARATARRYLDRYSGLPNYLDNLREARLRRGRSRQAGRHRLVDALVASVTRHDAGPPARDARRGRGSGGDDPAHARGPARGPRHDGSPRPPW